MTSLASPCYRCHKRNPKCHGTCPDYIKYRKKLNEAKTPPVDMTTEAHGKNITKLLRRAVKDRKDGRGNHTGD